MNQSDDSSVLREIRNWIRAASYGSVKSLLIEALPDEKTRAAYQMFDGANTVEQIRIACKLSPNTVTLLAQRCAAMGLLEFSQDKRRLRLFDLNDFGLAPLSEVQPDKKGSNDLEQK